MKKFFVVKNIDNGLILKYGDKGIFSDSRCFAAWSKIEKAQEVLEMVLYNAQSEGINLHLEIVSMTEEELNALPSKGTKVNIFKTAKSITKPTAEKKTRKSREKKYSTDFPNEFEDSLFVDFNKKCKTCDKACKQSYLAEIVFCPQYKKAV